MPSKIIYAIINPAIGIYSDNHKINKDECIGPKISLRHYYHLLFLLLLWVTIVNSLYQTTLNIGNYAYPHTSMNETIKIRKTIPPIQKSLQLSVAKINKYTDGIGIIMNSKKLKKKKSDRCFSAYHGYAPSVFQQRPTNIH